MNGMGKWVGTALALYAVLLGLLFAEIRAKADNSDISSLAADIRELRADVKQLLREMPRQERR